MTKELLILLTVLGIGAIISIDASGEGRVVNGRDSDIRNYPYMVSVRRDGLHTCGGVLISPEWVICTSICILRPGHGGPTEQEYTIQHSATVISPAATVNVSTFSDVILHPNFYPFENNSYIHDIALFRLNSPAYVSQYAILPAQFSDVRGGTPAIILGWGYNETNGVSHETLQEADVFVFSDEDCRNLHDDVIIHPSHICGGMPEGGRGHCTGDAGAPLLVNGVLVGIVSWGNGPCGELPDFYTQISYYREWIRLVTRL